MRARQHHPLNQALRISGCCAPAEREHPWPDKPTPTPSPSAAPAEPATPTGLREDVGRKIFEEHSQKEDANKHVDATTEAQLGAKDAETDMKDEPAAGGLDAAPEAIKNTV